MMKILYKKTPLIFGLTLALMMMGSVLEATAQIPGSVLERDGGAETIPDSEVSDDTTETMTAGDPCPEPKQALENTPNDLKNIQEDITRFTLCLQRAQLLNRLNDLAKENLDTINTTFDDKVTGLMEAVEPPQMPQIAMPAAPSIPSVEPLSEDGGEEDATTSTPMPMAQPAPSLPNSTWMIREVTGRGGELVAILVDDQDNLTQVKSGETLPDSDMVVETVSPTEVSVKSNDDIIKLDWMD